MKTPYEIKKGLYECEYKYGTCGICPYDRPGTKVNCQRELTKDALAYIQLLEKELEAVKRERDAMERDFLGFAMCENNICNYCNSLTAEICIRCDDMYPQGFKWRGVCPENTEVQGDANAT